jgi:hypothetical protein
MMAACGVYEDLPPVATSTPIAPNLLANPGFEDGSQPWAAADGSAQPFVVTDTRANSGSQSVLLAVEDASGPASSGVRQSSVTPDFPEFLSGMYFVDEWETDGAAPYLEFSVTAVAGDIGGVVADRTMRFVIAGAGAAPHTDAFSGAVFLQRDEPDTAAWTYFGYPVKRAFELRFGSAPASWTRIDVTLQVRFDAVAEGAAPGASAYFDDLYMGLQAGNTNRPEVRVPR